MIALISDIHGNYPALKEVFNIIDSLSVEEIYCLGDVVGYYNQINECCDELRKRNVKCIMGNHDWYMVAGATCLRSKIADRCIQYQRNIITKKNLEWLQTFPIYRRHHGVSMVHGGWDNPIDEYLKPDISYFSNILGNVFVSGHTHKQVIQRFGENVYCNPGSVGQPRDGDSRAAFATYNSGSFELHRAEYDINSTIQSMSDAGFESYYYNRLKTGAPHFSESAY